MHDGAVVFDTKLDNSGIEKGLKELSRKFDDVTEDIEDSGKDIGKSFDKVGDKAEDVGRTIKDSFDDSFKNFVSANLFASLAVDALKAIGDAAVELGKQAIEAAADIKAENAQFSQTFKGVEKTARNALDGIADETGITASRMQKSYASIYAFTKSIGAKTEEALDISGRALRAAADSAAYYDVSVEEAAETLQSFLKGNYENDAALGIAATETTRNAKANELYAKSFDRLTESQKVDVLLAMVEAGNQASGAMGQAAREADSWTNVTAELSEAWRQFLGLLGDPLIAAFTPVLQGITWGLEGIVSIFEDNPVDDEIAAWELAAESTAATVQQLRMEYDAAKDAARQSLDAQIGLFEELMVQSDVGAKTIIKNWESQRAAFADYSANLQKAVNMGLDQALVQQLSDGSAQSMSILNALVNDTDVNIDEINAAFQNVSESRDTVSAVMAEVQTDMTARLNELEGTVASEWGAMSGIVGAEITNMQNYINSLRGNTVYVDVVTRYIDSGSYSSSGTSTSGTTGYSAEPATAYAMPASIPYLAQGAVIPPNAPFYAVLGDQTHGRNLEAPEELIRQIVREESGAGTSDRLVQLLEILISTVEGIEVGDETIGRAAARYNRRSSRAGGY